MQEQKNLPSDKSLDTAPALQEIRIRFQERRFFQLNSLLISHAEGSLQYLLAVNGGGCVAMLGLVGAVEKWRLQNWPFWVLSVFIIGLILAGLGRAVLLIQAQYLVTGWTRDTSSYFSNQLDWREVTKSDQRRVKKLQWLPWLIGGISLVCFFSGTVTAGFLFFTLR